MSVILWFIQGVLAFAGLVATYLPLWASYRRWNVWGLEWQIWAMIGVAILSLSLISVIIRLVWVYVLPEAKLRRRKLNLEIGELENQKKMHETD